MESAKDDMTLTEVRLLVFLVKMLDSRSAEPKATHDIHVMDFARFYRLSRKDLYSFIDQLTDELMRQQFKISSEEGFKKYAWITDAEYLAGRGILRLTLHKKFEPFVIGLSRDFTQVPAEDFQNIRSKFSIWFLLLAAKGLKLGKREYSREKLQEMVGAVGYQNYSDFRRRVLEVAEEELKEKTSVYFEWEVASKSGKSPVSFDLFFHRNDEVVRKRKLSQVNRPALPFVFSAPSELESRLLDL